MNGDLFSFVSEIAGFKTKQMARLGGLRRFRLGGDEFNRFAAVADSAARFHHTGRSCKYCDIDNLHWLTRRLADGQLLPE